MMRINIHEAKTHLSSYLRKLKTRGETIIVCNCNQPIAEIRLLPSPQTGKRPIGLTKGQFSVPASFFESLPSDVLDAFSGKAT